MLTHLYDRRNMLYLDKHFPRPQKHIDTVAELVIFTNVAMRESGEPMVKEIRTIPHHTVNNKNDSQP